MSHKSDPEDIFYDNEQVISKKWTARDRIIVARALIDYYIELLYKMDDPLDYVKSMVILDHIYRVLSSANVYLNNCHNSILLNTEIEYPE